MSTAITVQGRQLSADDIQSIQRLMEAHPDWRRRRLSIALCRMWNWRTDVGRLKDITCRSMLRKLAQRQLIVLPEARQGGYRPRQIREVAHSCEPIAARIDALKPVELVLIDGRGDTDDLFHCLMARYHYLDCRGHVGEHLKYMVYDRHRRPLGCLLFGAAAWKVADRDHFIGWSAAARQANLKLTANNTRFLILPWVKVAHLASFVLGACLRRLKADWQALYGHPLVLVETFVDRARFTGNCYRAANWQKIGHTKGRSRQDRHQRIRVPVKDIYAYPLTAEFREHLCR